MADSQPLALPRSTAVVIDTNIVLDMFLFQDPAQGALCHAVQQGHLRWLATKAMQQELAYVLARESTQQQARKKGVTTQDVMQAMVDLATWEDTAPVCAFRCKDRTDQGFVDLAFVHQALLISKDKAVLKLARRLSGMGVGVATRLAQAQQMCRPEPATSAG